MTRQPVRYVIVKSSREYSGGNGYDGTTCAHAGVKPGFRYWTEAAAINAAYKLCRKNPVGFRVEVYRPASSIKTAAARFVEAATAPLPQLPPKPDGRVIAPNGAALADRLATCLREFMERTNIMDCNSGLFGELWIWSHQAIIEYDNSLRRLVNAATALNVTDDLGETG